jgi:hypothetical protein
MGAPKNVDAVKQTRSSAKTVVKDQELQINLNAIGEIKSSVEIVVKDMEALSAYVDKTRELIEYAKIHILLNEKEAARILSVTPEEMRQRRFYRREPRFFKIGDHARYSFAVLIDYIARCEVQPITVEEGQGKQRR